MYIEDTIAAISTPQGEGGIGIVRISGSGAEAIGLRLFRFRKGAVFVSHFLHYGAVVAPDDGAVLDEAMAVLMRAPHSYTREDVLELHCHGGMLVVERVLAAVLACGARLAEPGEFTRRAFVNGRIDLVQAEAVMDVIAAKTEASLALAQRQRAGALSDRIEAIRHGLTKRLAFVEAFIDFPEDDIGEADTVALRAGVGEALNEIGTLLTGFDEGRILREGISVLIVGKPNAGKSSLLNRLLKENRAIVTHIPGTTRDIIEETVNLGGLAVRLLDTAGIRHTDDVVEREGISRTLDKIPQADLVLFVLDSARPFGDEDRLILDAVQGKITIAVLNKSDLPPALDLPSGMGEMPCVALSAGTGAGIDELREVIRTTFLHGAALDSREFVAISRARHRDVLVSARSALHRFLSGLDEGRELETLAIDLRDALSAVGQVTGETTTDDLLDVVFSSFCIGK
ncbi:tRNA uridine-5-carboxymethylaminomethyl(34) synthesis GTPase MnmE [Geobacter sp. FeAm09]|uniref:tRNA uridine-5-carboxymethylaminomethyl(34) synthesis GTPase MnmE n=1 Tax=Geobacter sp. FeAm09 TaxID=2597769 RepID=UPI0011EC1808|nr:tRNA uridine-5-carboxymethylaminomethyl(34) synthesis GTPase MnmE [Geobacter sp. FeAm09]QEM69912.1 tRNA uridine-5-carboxymethylaminomethyl(34) synthesis GTPase MnmE [Geobacter sp. FeAm09]